MKIWIRRFIFILGLLVGLELAARSITYLMPLEIQQKYSDLQSHLKHTGKYIVNGRGARGSWPQKESIQIALFGSSVLAMKELSEEETWTNLLKQHSPIPIQIDNYGFGHNKLNSTVTLLEQLVRSNIHYDIIVFQLSPGSTFSLSTTLSMTYYSRWLFGTETKSYLYGMIEKFFNRRLKIESEIPPLSFARYFTQSPPKQELKIDDHKALKNDEYNCSQRLEKAGLVADVDEQVPEERVVDNKKSIEHIFTLARAVAPIVVWMPEGSAYHPNMRPYYFDTCYQTQLILGPVKTGLYLGRRTLAKRLDVRNTFVREVAERMNVKEINWLDPMLKRIQIEDDLFINDFHLTAKGSKEIYEIVKPSFFSLVEEAIKTRNK